MSAEFAKNALIEFDGRSGKLYINGEDFPFHITGFSLDTTGHAQRLTITIPLEQGAMVNFDPNVEALETAEILDDSDTMDAIAEGEQDVIDAKTLFPRPEFITVTQDTLEPDRSWVLRHENHSSATDVVRYVEENDYDAEGWYFGYADGYDAGRGPWPWDRLAKDFPGTYYLLDEEN